jgi:hypothetical protein
VDWPTWLEASEAAVEQTLRAEESRLATLAKQSQLWFGCCTYLFDRGLPVDYPEPVLECTAQASASLSLATHGYYTCAISTLRQQLELALLSVVFTSDKTLRRAYMRGDRMPPFHKLATRVFNRPDLHDYGEAMKAKALDSLGSQVDYNSVHLFWRTPLSAVVHSALAAWNMLDWGFGPTPQYSAKAFDLWADAHEVTQHMSLLWVLLAHRSMFGSIERRNPQEWSVLFDPVETTYLAEVHEAA